MNWDGWVRFRYGDPEIDLLWLKDGDRNFEQVYEIALENTERLCNVQTFNRGLTKALEVVIDIVDGDEPCGCYEEEGEHPYYCDRCNAIGKARFVLDKAKEDLGDESASEIRKSPRKPGAGRRSRQL